MSNNAGGIQACRHAHKQSAIKVQAKVKSEITAVDTLMNSLQSNEVVMQ